MEMESELETSFNSISDVPLNSTEIHPQSSVTFEAEINGGTQETQRLMSNQSEVCLNRFIDAQDLGQHDTAEITKTYNKIVKVFGDCTKTGDETDASTGVINMKKMKHVIDSLDTGDNVFHYFMNTISVLGGTPGIKKEEKKELQDELHVLADYSPKKKRKKKKKQQQEEEQQEQEEEEATTTISLQQYQKYAAQQKGISRRETMEEENKQKEMWMTKSLRRMLQKNTHPGEKLMRYFKAIGDAKKIYLSPTKIAIPLMALFLLIFYIVQTPELTNLLKFRTEQTGEPWRYFTYSLLHDTSKHLFINIIVLLPVGWGLEVVHGTIWVTLLYIIGVVSSALAFYVFDKGTLVGCSGGVFCLVAASLSTCIMNWKEDKAVVVRVWKKNTPIAYAGGMSRNLKFTGIIIYALVDFGSAGWRRYQGEDIGVSVLAHIFGALTGFLTGFTLLKDEKEERWEKAWKPFCLCVFSVAFGMALALNIAEYRGAEKVFSF